MHVLVGGGDGWVDGGDNCRCHNERYHRPVQGRPKAMPSLNESRPQGLSVHAHVPAISVFVIDTLSCSPRFDRTVIT